MILKVEDALKSFSWLVLGRVPALRSGSGYPLQVLPLKQENFRGPGFPLLSLTRGGVPKRNFFLKGLLYLFCLRPFRAIITGLRPVLVGIALRACICTCVSFRHYLFYPSNTSCPERA